MPEPTIQGFKLTTEDETFEVPDPPERYFDRTGVDSYVSRDGLDEYESRS